MPTAGHSTRRIIAKAIQGRAEPREGGLRLLHSLLRGLSGERITAPEPARHVDSAGASPRCPPQV